MEETPIAITWGMRQAEQGGWELPCISENLGQSFNMLKAVLAQSQGDGSCFMGPHLPGLTMVVKKGRKETYSQDGGVVDTLCLLTHLK